MMTATVANDDVCFYANSSGHLEPLPKNADANQLLKRNEAAYFYQRRPYEYFSNAGKKESTFTHLVKMDSKQVLIDLSLTESFNKKVTAFDRCTIGTKELVENDKGETEWVEFRGKEIKQIYDRRLTWEKHHEVLSHQLAASNNLKDNLFMVIGDSNLLFNDHVTAWMEDIGVIHPAGEPLDRRFYSSFAKFKDGTMKVIDIQYRNIDGKIRAFEVTTELVGETRKITHAVDISDQLKFATSGQRVIRDGKGVSKIQLKEEWTDLRWVFKFPFLHITSTSKSSSGDAFFGLDQMILEGSTGEPNEKAYRALKGENITFHLSLWDHSAVSEDTLREALLDPESHYVEVSSPEDVKEEGQYAFHDLIENDCLQSCCKEPNAIEKTRGITMKLRQGRYPHNLIGTFSEDDSIGVLQFEGKSGRVGCTLDELSLYLEKEAKMKDAVILDNGADTKMMLKIINQDTKKEELSIVNGITTGARNVHFAALGFALKQKPQAATVC